MEGIDPQEYPQHVKLDKIQDISQKIGLFLETIQGEGFRLCHWGKVAIAEEPCPARACVDGKWYGDKDRLHVRCKGTGYVTIWQQQWVPDARSVQRILAKYFGIDYDELMAEKDRMLTAIRAAAD